MINFQIVKNTGMEIGRYGTGLGAQRSEE